MRHGVFRRRNGCRRLERPAPGAATRSARRAAAGSAVPESQSDRPASGFLRSADRPAPVPSRAGSGYGRRPSPYRPSHSSSAVLFHSSRSVLSFSVTRFGPLLLRRIEPRGHRADKRSRQSRQRRQKAAPTPTHVGKQEARLLGMCECVSSLGTVSWSGGAIQSGADRAPERARFCRRSADRQRRGSPPIPISGRKSRMLRCTPVPCSAGRTMTYMSSNCMKNDPARDAGRARCGFFFDRSAGAEARTGQRTGR